MMRPDASCSRNAGGGRLCLGLALPLLLAVAPVPAGCAVEPNDAGAGRPATIVDITVSAINPTTVVPGSELKIEGGSFVPDIAGGSKLLLSGTFTGSQVSLSLDAHFVDYDEMVVDWPGAAAAGLPADEGVFSGEAVIEAYNAYDRRYHRSTPVRVELDIRHQLQPWLAQLQNEVIFVNDPVLAIGDGFLLGGAEGETVAIVEGCFTPQGAPSCTPVDPTEIVAQPFQPFDRSRVQFPFSPHIAGIQPGHFEGSVRLENRHGPQGGAAVLGTDAHATSNDIIEPTIFSFEPPAASLGQYVMIAGGGFVGVPVGQSDPALSLTIIELEGEFTPEGSPEAQSVSLSLIPEFVSGQLVRYVVDETDELGQSVDLRTVAGDFVGTARPVVQYAADEVQGAATPVRLGIAHVRQVVWIRFLPAYVEALRHLGLRAVDQRIRDRVFAECREAYDGINVDFRAEQPTDFALYSIVDLAGTDPNGYGLLGYDNTPGKDNGNLRLHDKIGGVNALTQEDGYPGYGGVFVESLFGFSKHPGSFATSIDGADDAFDQLFDPFRPDLRATPVAAAEVAGAPVLSSGEGCPASSGDRPMQIACAIWALGSVIGTITAHEIAHSLGLADPYGPEFHNSSDFPNALMDSGYYRSFRERARILGEGPGRFCHHNYEYLRQVLPTSLPDVHPDRPECY